MDFLSISFTDNSFSDTYECTNARILAAFSIKFYLTVFPYYEDSLLLLTDVLRRCFYVQKWSHISHISYLRIMKNSDHMNVFNERRYLFIYFSCRMFWYIKEYHSYTPSLIKLYMNQNRNWVLLSKWWTACLVVFVKNNKKFMYSPWLFNWVSKVIGIRFIEAFDEVRHFLNLKCRIT